MSRSLLRSVRVRFCQPCGTTRQFVNGTCLMAPWHLGTCPDCPRPTTGGELCDGCKTPDARLWDAVDRARDSVEDATAADDFDRSY